MPGHGLKQADAANLSASLAQRVKSKPLKDEIKMALNVADPVEGRDPLPDIGLPGPSYKGGDRRAERRPGRPRLDRPRPQASTAWLASLPARPPREAVGLHRPDMHLN